MKSKKNVKQKKRKETPKMREKELSLGDKVYATCNIILCILILWYLDDKYKYEYTKNPKDISAEAAFIWLGITIITYCIYELLKKIYKHLKSKNLSK